MPDKNIQTVYYNKKTRLEEWRYRYYLIIYRCLGGTRVASRHLKDVHELPRDSVRDTIAKNI
jgi:hypothetical protein